MATIEKLFVQIFERKKWIIDQAKHQSTLFDQQLASKLIIDGIVPPPWLQTSFLHPQPSHFTELNTNFNSGAEFPRSPPGIHYSGGDCLNKVLVADSREVLQHRLRVEAGSLNDDSDAGVRLSIPPQCAINDAGCALNGAPDPHTSPISPQGRGDAISEDYQDPTLSLARLQRSKSRQRALEFRNSSKSARYGSRCDNKDDPVPSRIIESSISSLQSGHEDESELAKPSSNPTRSGSLEEGNFCCERKDIPCSSDKLTSTESPSLQSSSLDVDNSSYISSQNGRLCPIGSSKRHSDQVRQQLDLFKPSPSNIKHCEEAGSVYCGSEEYNFDTAEQSGLRQRYLDVDNSPYISSENGRLCPIGSSKLHSDLVKEQLDLPKPSSGNIECCEEARLGYFSSEENNFDTAEQSGSQQSSLNVDNSLYISDGKLYPIESSERHSAQVSEQLELSKPSSCNMECCEGGRLEYCRSQDHNFDAEPSAQNKGSSPSIMEIRDKSSEKKPSSFLDGKKAVNEKEKCNSSIHIPFPPIEADLVEEQESQKALTAAHSEQRCENRGSLNGNTLLSADISLQHYEDAAACSMLLSDEPAKQNISFKDQTSNLQHSHENLVEIPLLDTDNASVLIRDRDSFEDLTVMASCVPSSGEKAGNLEGRLTNSGISQCQDSDLCQGSISGFKDNYHYTSTECQIAERSTDLKASGPHKELRKVEVQLESGTPASEGLRDEQLQIIKKATLVKYSMHEDANQKPVLEFQRISLSEEDLQPNVSKSPVELMHLKKDMHFLQGSKSSCRLPVKEDHSRFESNNRDTGMQSFMPENQTLDPTENLHLGYSEPLVDTGKSKQKEESGNFTYCSLVAPHNQTLDYIGADKDMPALEGFLMQTDYEQPCISVGGINFDKLYLSNSIIERASILEKLCKSACINSPLSPENFKLTRVPNLYYSLPNGLVEAMDVESDLPMNDQNHQLTDSGSCLDGEVNCSPHGRSFSDYSQSFNSQSACEMRKPVASPFRMFLEGISSNSFSSGKRSNLSSELPCISEENENTDEMTDKFAKDMVSNVITNSVKREPLADVADNVNLHVTVSEAAVFGDRWSLQSLNTELSNKGTHSRIKENPGNEKKSKRKYLNKAENQDISSGANGVKRVTRSSYDRFSRSELSCNGNFKKEGRSFAEKESKHKNIVSNITSFIPLVQQREAAAILKGKRDIKVKAIEAAEAAKRLAEKKENERQMKKEALKLERSRMEQENLRQLELEKKKKEEERKKKEDERRKKEADLAAKKRQREEEERKERERKRMRVEEVRKRLQDHGGKSLKEKKEVKIQPNDQKPRDRKGCKEDTKKMGKGSGNDNFDKLSVTEFQITASTCSAGAGRSSLIMEDSETTSAHCLDAEVPKNLIENRVSETREEQSYQISPYKGSDDEDEDDDDNHDDMLTNKFVPSWASKDSLALLFASQQKVDPEVIFPPDSFCDIAEVLLPRKHQLK